jgi:phosphoribosylformylglycinamidine cyclo-ligase
VLAGWGNFSLESVEGTWNLGLGQAVVVDAASADKISSKLNELGVPTWQLGVIENAPADLSSYVHGAKGVDGGAVRLVGKFAN